MNKLFLSLLLLLISNCCFAETMKDDLVLETLKDIPEPIVNTNYNYESTAVIPVRLTIVEPINTEKEVYEGQKVNFKLSRHVIYKGKIIAKRDTIVPARVSTIITSGMNGIPASIVFDNFEIPNIKPNQLTNSYEVFGQDRSLIVYPIKWMLTILPPTGSLTNFIKGGHAKVKTNREIVLYYHPNWI